MILTVTLNPAVDEEYVVPEFRPGGWIRATKSSRSPGGKGINVSTLLAQFGYSSTAMGFLAGFNGEYIRHALRTFRITTNFVHIPGETRTNVYIIDDTGHVETGISEAGPSVSPEAMDRLRKVYRRILQRTRMVILGGSLPPGAPEDIFAEFVLLAREKGIPTVVDAAGPPLMAALDAGPTVVKADHRFMSKVMGRSLTSLDNLIDVVSGFHEKGVEWAVVSYRTYGNVFFSPDGIYLALADRKSVRSIFSASDALLAGLVVAREEGMSTKDTIRFAMASAWECAAHVGKGIRNRKAVEEYIPLVELEHLS
jgi:1-phosphofructokinase family hexose kinase